MPLQSCQQRAGCLEASPRSRQLQPDTGKSGDRPGRPGRGSRRLELRDPWPRKPSLLVWVGKLRQSQRLGDRRRRGVRRARLGGGDYGPGLPSYKKPRNLPEPAVEERAPGWAAPGPPTRTTSGPAPPLRSGCSARY